MDGARDRRGDQAPRHRLRDLRAPRGTALKKGALQPHRWRYWLTPSGDADFEHKVQDICTVYREAPTLAAQGERVVSTDALTGVQALERKHPSLPMLPGQVERRELEYIRHGTCALIVSRDVVSGQIIAPSAGPTRDPR